MQKTKYRRSQYIVRKGFQLKYIGLILGIVLISSFIVGYTIYYNSWVLLGDSLAKVYPQGRLAAIFHSVNIKLVVNIFFVTILCVGIGIVTSHKIAGPIYRIKAFVNGLTNGDCAQRLHLRKGDDLQDLADALNKLAEKLEKK
ncbi:MAG: hypothetical protein ISS91_00925 [Candidatus Omnitrophica bacterium]|nr:hypothetical protein [Candidatus Omnitrophota bacterium]